VPEQRYQIRFQAAVQRAIAKRLPEAVAAAVLEFCGAAFALNPYRAGKPLFGPLAGCHRARRGIYRIDETNRTIHVLDVDYRVEICRRPHS
jgi:mRNA interferase RelE/StbE